MKVVIDTNVFVSSFFGGKPREVIDLWRRGRIVLCVSPAIFEEYIGVLQRMGLDGRDELRELINLFRRSANIVFSARPPDLRVVAADPDDDKFIACAVACEAETIISGDKHLTDISTYMGIRILSPAQFLLKLSDTAT